MRLAAPFCPKCGAPVSVPVGARRTVCEYCRNHLVVEAESTTYVAADNPVAADPESVYPEPDAKLFRVEAARFELAVLEQRIEGTCPERFISLELDDDRFALVSLRATDEQARSIPAELDPAAEALEISLQEDGDPGLAANMALEALCENGFSARLDCVVLLFDPRRSEALVYIAGAQDAVWWVSQEEGRAMTAFRSHDPLERRTLREARDHFSNSKPVLLARDDLLVLVSAGYAGRGGETHSNSIHALTTTLNAHLAEDSQRVVTLAKNAFWKARGPMERGVAPSGDIRVAAVRARASPLAETVKGPGEIVTLTTPRFQFAAWKAPDDHLELLPLHAARFAVFWIRRNDGRSLADPVVTTMREAILQVLDRPDHGDNENPREAGRRALAAAALSATDVSLVLVLLIDVHRAAKYFRVGWKQPIALGARGLRDPPSLQAYDEGGDAWPQDGQRLVFPGALTYDGQPTQGEALAASWQSGKASALYDALFFHWKTKKAERFLDRLARAIQADAKLDELRGLAVLQ